jgi:hypothetical protein
MTPSQELADAFKGLGDHLHRHGFWDTVAVIAEGALFSFPAAVLIAVLRYAAVSAT